MSIKIYEEAQTFRAAADSWLSHKDALADAGHMSPSSIRQYRRWLNPILAFMGDRDAGTINVETINKYKEARLAAKVAPVSINNELKIVGAVMAHAEELGWGTAPRIRRVPQQAREEELPDLDQIDRFMKRLPPSLYYPLEFSRLTGLSWHELCRLQWQDIDLDRQLVRIGYRPDFRVKTPTRRREITITRQALVVLVEVHELCGKWTRDTDPVFRNAGNAAKELRKYRGPAFDATKAKTRRTGETVIELTPSLMRKVFASTAADEGVPEHHLQYIMGHAAGSAITRKHYIRVAKKKAQESSQKIADALTAGR